MRLDPNRGFSSIFDAFDLGSSGEVYAINREGYALSRLEYQAELIQSQRLKASTSILNVRMPNYVLEHILPPLLDGDIAFDDHNINEYIDYRDAKVLGSWRWLKDFDIGLGAEIDSAEVLYDYFSIRDLLIATLTVALTTIVFISGFMMVIGRRAHEVASRSQAELEALVKERTDQLEKSENDTRSTLMSAPIAMVMIDTSGNIYEANIAAMEMLGGNRAQLIGSAFKQTFVDDQQTLVGDAINHYLARPAQQTLLEDHELQIRAQNQNLFYVEISLTPLVLSAGSLHVVAIKDITAAQEAAQALRDASQAKSDFLANMEPRNSHAHECDHRHESFSATNPTQSQSPQLR